MRTALVALVAGSAFLAWALAVWVLGHFLARVGRYRAYRRNYPAAPRGSVWKHVGR